MQSEVDRLGQLPLPQLAASVMKEVGPSSDHKTAVGEIVEAFAPEAFRTGNEDACQRLRVLVGEGLQVLEHASLVCFLFHSGSDGLYYVPTRLGRAAVEGNAIERILGGGTL